LKDFSSFTNQRKSSEKTKEKNKVEDFSYISNQRKSSGKTKVKESRRIFHPLKVEENLREKQN
jgi:ABC-type branched-subunit amino acid transport system ATPase component